jgi:hypothetical protein
MGAHGTYPQTTAVTIAFNPNVIQVRHILQVDKMCGLAQPQSPCCQQALATCQQLRLWK